MVERTTEELIREFMDASALAEAHPDEALLRSMQEICASLSRSHSNTWDDQVDSDAFGFADPDSLDEPTLHSEDVPIHAEATTIRDLVIEARGYIRLSLFDLAEGAVSHAIVLLRSTASSESSRWDQPTTQVGVKALPKSPSELFFRQFAPRALGGWLVRVTREDQQIVDAWPVDAGADPHGVHEAGGALIQTGGAFGPVFTICLFVADGLWFGRVTEQDAAILRFEPASLGLLVSRLRQLDAQQGTDS